MDIGLSIATGMHKSKLSGVDLARQMRTSPAYISNIKKGKRDISLRQAEKMSGIFNVKLSEFISWGEK
jgi:transcriptional regulator with XRE-family HTH domain